MKRKKAFLIGIIFAAAMMAGCSGNEAAGKTGEETGSAPGNENTESSESLKRTDGRRAAENMVFGTVTETGEGYIVVEKEDNPRRKENSSGTAGDGGEDLEAPEKNGEQGSGETQKIKTDGDTVIRRVSMAAPEGRERPERADGEKPDGGQPPEIPERSEENGDSDKKPSGNPGSRFGEDEGEEIAFQDIEAGVQVSVVLGDDGIADTIRVMEKTDAEASEETVA